MLEVVHFQLDNKDDEEILTLTTLWANSADNKLMIFLLFFPENRIWHFLQIVSITPLEAICMKCQILFSGKNI